MTGCNDFFTVKYFLLEYNDLPQMCDRHYRVSSWSELFEWVPSKTLISYLIEIDLYSKIQYLILKLCTYLFKLDFSNMKIRGIV
jgi:hypothetical protein